MSALTIAALWKSPHRRSLCEVCSSSLRLDGTDISQLLDSCNVFSPCEILGLGKVGAHVLLLRTFFPAATSALSSVQICVAFQVFVRDRDCWSHSLRCNG
jgi:hypothetical protein